MKKLLLLAVLATFSFGNTVESEHIFGCKDKKHIEGMYRALSESYQNTYAYMYANGCAIFKKSSVKIVQSGAFASKVVIEDEDRDYYYWVDSGLIKGIYK